MPLCKIETNLPTVPSDLAVHFSKAVAQALSKPEERITVSVSAGVQMTRGGSTDPTILVQIWSIGVFSKEQNPTYANKFFDFLKQHLPAVSEKRIVFAFHPIEPTDVVIRT
jgi:hypothetical protein